MLVHAPAPIDFQSVLDSSQFGRKVVAFLDSQSVCQVMVLSQQLRLGAETLRYHLEDRPAKVLRHLLRQNCGLQSLLPDDLALIGLQGAMKEAEERRLAGAVTAQEAHSLACLDRQIGVVQDRRAFEAHADVG